MRFHKYIFYAFCIAINPAYGANAENATDLRFKHNLTEKGTDTDIAEYTDLVNNVYNKFVFAIDADVNDKPEIYFTDNALKKLQEDYDFDCQNDGPCYAFYALRTMMQDSRPGSDGESKVYGIEPSGDGWYVVLYSDMGWPGKTRIKIIDGKIDTYERMAK
ncbi:MULTISPECIES: hypothetical protein [Duncaniella]|uniref:Uncharacterized protein n=2 Tax=Duncaniella TaxID=2518495 RepID=A0A4P7W436_9BACT|nr:MULTISPECIES: hypothetical protein [Duncaniella]MCX4284751.1 hypothetical protein [Duncaniella dubosii]QCD42697.1 hypothetical protein E7747_10660 [Duncaniella dubosii]